MISSDWISLSDYSSKYRTSVSTLRRRIKREEIRYVFENGKYYLPDQLPQNIVETKKSFSHAPPKSEELSLGQSLSEKDFLGFEESLDLDFDIELKKDKRFESEVSFLNTEKSPPQFTRSQSSSESIQIQNILSPLLDQMNRELKKAYSATLQEKEEQIIILKEQVADLKTLINFLEAENKRLSELNPKPPLNSFFRNQEIL